MPTLPLNQPFRTPRLRAWCELLWPRGQATPSADCGCPLGGPEALGEIFPQGFLHAVASEDIEETSFHGLHPYMGFYLKDS